MENLCKLAISHIDKYTIKGGQKILWQHWRESTFPRDFLVEELPFHPELADCWFWGLRRTCDACILWAVGRLDFSEQTPNKVICSACLHSLWNQLLFSYFIPRQVGTYYRELSQSGLEGLVLSVRRCLPQDTDTSYCFWPLRVPLTLLCTLKMPFVLFLMEHGTVCLECLESAGGIFFSSGISHSFKNSPELLTGFAWYKMTVVSMKFHGGGCVRGCVQGLLTAVLAGQQKRSDIFSHLCQANAYQCF